jgi:hypothetical protein
MGLLARDNAIGSHLCNEDRKPESSDYDIK